MDASLDTDIIIHLYKSNKKELLFSSFDKLYIHEYLLRNEIQRKSNLVYEEVLFDVDNSRIEIIGNKELIKMGIKSLFENYKSEYYYLFDMGELYAIALAKAMGIAAFTSDDTKDFGPHDTLVILQFC
ncbi:MAG: hypothetical protein GX283_02505 [Clostridiaceae bacterium]|jgi:predicted nucleic acid-binding protein|nr:hypothetical protein [Clostridiaceae bacterium]